MSHVPRSAAFGLEQTCFKMFRNSSFLDLRLQGVDVTCAALSCLRFASDVCPHVSLFQFLQVFDCKGLMSHVPHSAAFGLDQMCYAAGGSRRAPRPKAGVASSCRLRVFLYCFGERRVVFVVKARAAARE